MFGVRHDIEGEFPEFQTEINHLKNNNPDFLRLLVEYDETDKRIYGLEQQSLPVSDNYFGNLKRQRVVLKDQLYTILKQSNPA